MLEKNNERRHTRNGAIFDRWSIVHFLTGTIFGWLMAPVAAFIIMTAWEPLEILVISPIVARYKIVFGFETIRNSVSDIVFNTLGIVVGAYALLPIVDAPFKLF